MYNTSRIVYTCKYSVGQHWYTHQVEDVENTRIHLRCVRTSTAIRIESGLDRVRTILSRTTETVRVRNALCGYWLSRLHTQALILRDREQTPTSKMIAHSRKAVDEDGRLCFVLFFFYTSLLPIKTDSFTHYFFARNNISCACTFAAPQIPSKAFVPSLVQ